MSANTVELLHAEYQLRRSRQDDPTNPTTSADKSTSQPPSRWDFAAEQTNSSGATPKPRRSSSEFASRPNSDRTWRRSPSRSTRTVSAQRSD